MGDRDYHLFSFPVGVGAAIYLEEYASDTALNRLIQTNINNLAGVPSIIYGILGLAIFVRVLEPLTSGALFGTVADPTTANGRTILSAGLTLGLADFANDHYQRPGSNPCRSKLIAAGQLWCGCHQMADHLEPCVA